MSTMRFDRCFFSQLYCFLLDKMGVDYSYGFSPADSIVYRPCGAERWLPRVPSCENWFSRFFPKTNKFKSNNIKSDGGFSARLPWRDVLELDWLGHFGAANFLAFVDGQQQLSESYELPMGHHGSGNKSRYQLCSWVIPACPVYWCSGRARYAVASMALFFTRLPLRT